MDIKLLSVTKQYLELVGVVHLHRHIGAKEFGRVVDLDPSGVVRQEGVSRSVGFVKSVACKPLHQVKYFVGFNFGDVVLGRACAKDCPMVGHFFGIFLTHRTAQHISATQRVATQNLRGLHHLFLVHHDAVGLRQHLCNQGVWVLNLFASVFTRHKTRNQIHGARAVERVKRN